VLYLVPEIALTTQLMERINRHFGASSIVYHSRLTDKQRSLVWQSLSDTGGTGAMLVLGVRSSLFLPYRNLGLIIVDEEHDGSYKQQDPAPRYNARDAAIMLAGIHNAKVVLGSATPSIESYHNAVTGKHGLFELLVRHGETELPEIAIADTRKALKRKEMVSHFTPELVTAVDDALKSGEQVILFRNRRGFAPFVQCSECGWIPQCMNCSVSLTYHRNYGKMKCHYCGFSVAVPSECGECGSRKIRTVGFGTEKIEEELRIVFPEARVGRIDQDTTRGKNGHKKIIDDFASGVTDILIGTQMISKGLDFANLTIVGILDADSLMNYPDFRSYERAFQMMEQVSGRSGRRKKRGRVVIQTGDPRNPVLAMVLRHDYRGMYESQMEERELFGYPPFTRLVSITVKHRQKEALDSLAEEFAAGLRGYFGKRVMGPEYPHLSRLQSYYVKSILIKIEKVKSLSVAKKYIAGAIDKIYSKPGIGSLRINVDVDPL
jgi:primosomal protein N' (replication factor Y)